MPENHREKRIWKRLTSRNENNVKEKKNENQENSRPKNKKNKSTESHNILHGSCCVVFFFSFIPLFSTFCDKNKLNIISHVYTKTDKTILTYIHTVLRDKLHTTATWTHTLNFQMCFFGRENFSNCIAY